MTTSASEVRTNEMSSHASTFDNDLEASQRADNNNASGEDIIEKIESNGSPVSTTGDGNVKQDFPDLAPSRSMEFPDGISSSPSN
jgi:hypothetical protein